MIFMLCAGISTITKTSTLHLKREELSDVITYGFIQLGSQEVNLSQK